MQFAKKYHKPSHFLGYVNCKRFAIQINIDVTCRGSLQQLVYLLPLTTSILRKYSKLVHCPLSQVVCFICRCKSSHKCPHRGFDSVPNVSNFQTNRSLLYPGMDPLLQATLDIRSNRLLFSINHPFGKIWTTSCRNATTSVFLSISRLFRPLSLYLKKSYICGQWSSLPDPPSNLLIHSCPISWAIKCLCIYAFKKGSELLCCLPI